MRVWQALTLQLNAAVVQSLFMQSLQQSIVTEPIARAVEGLLFGELLTVHACINRQRGSTIEEEDTVTARLA